MSAQRKSLLPGSQRGFAIVAGIFLLVIMAALGAFMLIFSNTQQLTSAQDVQGSRTYWAAKAGIQWAAFKLQPPAVACPAASTTFMLDGFNVTVTCTSNTYIEGTDNKIIYWIESKATGSGTVGSLGYTERSLNALMEF